uniref:Protein HHL1, chloroplastic isoform X3 n=1 Tax=Elaeis guineensis var. tenera TaxID=51953 RepID=A0A6I9RPX9_ELAGV|nr:protein HHL1, chloroplastic isoform X3 [Elaeis guineensis]
MEVAMSVRALARLPLSNSKVTAHENGVFLGSPLPLRSQTSRRVSEKKRQLMVVEAKGKRGMMARQFQRPPPPPLPKIEDDGNPRFVIFIRTTKDEKEIQKTAFKQYRVLRSATAFRYGYKLIENNNLRAAISTNDVIELPTQEELKTVLDKVKDFVGNAAGGAKESFGKLTALGSLSNEESESRSKVKS